MDSGRKSFFVSHLFHLIFILLILANPQCCETRPFLQRLTISHHKPPTSIPEFARWTKPRKSPIRAVKVGYLTRDARPKVHATRDFMASYSLYAVRDFMMNYTMHDSREVEYKFLLHLLV